MKPLIYKTKEIDMENKLIIKRYKIPEDLLMDILRILFGNNIKHKIIGIRQRQNSVLLNVNFDLVSIKNREAKENMEGILTDYSEFMKGLLGNTVLMFGVPTFDRTKKLRHKAPLTLNFRNYETTKKTLQ